MNNDIAAMVATGILFFVTVAWISLFAKVFRGSALLAFEPRRIVPWGLIAVILSFFLLIGGQIAAGVTFGAHPDAELTVEQTNLLLIATAVTILAATLISIGLIHSFARAGREDFGLSLDHVPFDLFIGIYAFLILAPVTFGIQFVFVSVFGIESHHPLIDLLKEDTSGRLFGVVTLLAVVVAPISEEYFFRVLLQGWLERVFQFRGRQNPEVELAIDSQAEQSSGDETSELGGVSPDPEENPYASPSLEQAVDQAPTSLIVPTPSVYPMVISAAVFALMHWTHGPDPAALFVLALGLGYLYQRTHRWLPSVVTHACLNGTTMLLLWFGLDELP